MSVSVTAHSKLYTLLNAATPSASWSYVYQFHAKANLLLPALSVQVSTDSPVEDTDALVNQELIDYRESTLIVKVHTAYRLGLTDTATTKSIIDAAIREIRENTDLGNGFRVYDVFGVDYDVEHTESATTGGQFSVNVRKVEYYVQS
jgi:hypothetical protein